MYTLIGILFVVHGIGFVIAFHEFGHFAAAKWTGTQVLEFSIGFGPRLISFVFHNTRYSLKLLPFGGCCSMLGENDANAMALYDNVKDEGDNWNVEGVIIRKIDVPSLSFKNKTPYQRLFIAAAGCFNNFLLGIILAFVFSASFGTHPAVVQDGIHTGKNVYSIDGHRIYTSLDASVYSIAGRDKGTVDVVFTKDGHSYSELVAVSEKGELPFNCNAPMVKPRSLVEAMEFSGYLARYSVTSAFYGLKALIFGTAKRNEVQGIAGIAGSFGTAAGGLCKSRGILYMMLGCTLFLSFISINLGIANLLPIPALDGSVIIFTILELVRGRKLPEKVMVRIQNYGMSLLMGIMCLTIINDAVNFVMSKL